MVITIAGSTFSLPVATAARGRESQSITRRENCTQLSPLMTRNSTEPASLSISTGKQPGGEEEREIKGKECGDFLFA